MMILPDVGNHRWPKLLQQASVKIKYDYVVQWVKYKDLHGRLSYLWETSYYINTDQQ